MLEQLKDLCDIEGVRIHKVYNDDSLEAFHVWNDIENEQILSVSYGRDILEYEINSYVDESKTVVDNPTFEDLREIVFGIIESA